MKHDYDVAIRYFSKAAMADTRPETTGRKPQEPSSGERLLPSSDAANLLRLSTSWLAKARMRGDGPPYVKLGRSVRYREVDLIQWLKSRARRSTGER